VVADGVGSTRQGGVAAQLVVEQLPSYVARHLAGADLHDGQAAARLAGAVAQLSDDLYARSRTDSNLADADTTVVAAVITDSRAVIAHLGDSRAYLYRDRQVQRLTSDHTVVQAVMDAGALSAEEAAHHPNRSVLTRHVLMTPPAKPDVGALDLQPGDRILLCSDGLHGVVDDATLAAILADCPDPADACRALTAAANQAGGPDNITAVVVDAGQLPPPPAPRPAPLDATTVPTPTPVAHPQSDDPRVPTTQQRSPSRPSVPPTRPATGPAPQIGAPPAQPRRRRPGRAMKLGLIGAIVVIFAAAGVTGYFLWPRPHGPQTPTGQPARPSGQAAPPAAPAVQTLLTGVNHPEGVAVDNAGNVYVVVDDDDNARVVELAAGSSAPPG
jgi:protein phosphatase